MIAHIIAIVALGVLGFDCKVDGFALNPYA